MEKSRKIEKEKHIVALMIKIYCRRHEGNIHLCSNCQALIEYAHIRLDHCKFGGQKLACKYCKIHCYNPMYREQIRAIMRFSGPRMMIYAPIEFIRHYFFK